MVCCSLLFVLVCCSCLLFVCCCCCRGRGCPVQMKNTFTPQGCYLGIRELYFSLKGFRNSCQKLRMGVNPPFLVFDMNSTPCHYDGAPGTGHPRILYPDSPSMGPQSDTPSPPPLIMDLGPSIYSVQTLVPSWMHPARLGAFCEPGRQTNYKLYRYPPRN